MKLSEADVFAAVEAVVADNFIASMLEGLFGLLILGSLKMKLV